MSKWVSIFVAQFRSDATRRYAATVYAATDGGNCIGMYIVQLYCTVLKFSVIYESALISDTKIINEGN